MFKRQKRQRMAIAMLAALSCSRPSGSNQRVNHPPPPPDRGEDAFALAPLTTYAGCDDLRKDLREILATERQFAADQIAYWASQRQDSDDSSQTDTSALKSTPYASFAVPDSAMSTVGTNLQVSGVDEADDIKISSQAIFVADNQNMGADQVIRLYRAAPLTYVGDLRVPQITTPRLFLAGERLTVVGLNAGDTSQTKVLVYNVANLRKPALEHSWVSKGQVVGTRMVGQQLYLVMRDSLKRGEIPQELFDDRRSAEWATLARSANIDQSFDFAGDEIAGMPCRSVLKLPRYVSQYQVQRIVSWNVASGTITDQLAIPGKDDNIYMTLDNLYVYGQPERRPMWNTPSSSATSAWKPFFENVVVTKINVDTTSGKLNLAARGAVDGHLKLFDSQWAFNEIDHNGDKLLAVVTSTGDLRAPDKSNPPTNHLFMLRQYGRRMTVGAHIKDFGKNEDVRAVRYLGDKAYVVTFERTDPLYTIDLADPLAPKVRGELIIPGFSMYLHPHGKDHLIGTGFDTVDSGEADITRSFFQGLLVQYFDISNPDQPKRLSVATLGKRGSYSEANQDSHAFYYDGEAKITAVPVVLFDDQNTDAAGNQNPVAGLGQWNNAQNENFQRLFSGAIFYRIGDAGLSEIARVSHADMLPADCLQSMQPLFWTNPVSNAADVRRIYRVGETIYTVSNFGVKTLKLATLSVEQSVFDPYAQCVNRYSGVVGGFD